VGKAKGANLDQNAKTEVTVLLRFQEKYEHMVLELHPGSFLDDLVPPADDVGSTESDGAVQDSKREDWEMTGLGEYSIAHLEERR